MSNGLNLGKGNQVDVMEETAYDFDVADVQNEVAIRVQNSPEVQKMAATLELTNRDAVMSFGHESAKEISAFADRLLQTTSKADVDKGGKMMKNLASIMKSFKPEDFTEEKKGFLAKLFKKADDQIQAILNKYQTMDGDIQKVFVEIKGYESEIKKTNQDLEQMFQANIKYYESLEKYVAACEIIKLELDTNYLPQIQQKVEATNSMDLAIVNELNEIRDIREAVDQRQQDLEMAKMISLQTAPQIRMIQKGNNNLLRKINSSFVVTIPIFKLGISQAITMKRQKIQADALGALDDVTNDMIMQNATNIADNSKRITELTGQSSIKIETIENSFNTIMQGIEDTLRIEEDNKAKRIADREKLKQLQEDMRKKKF